jgi:DNA-binding IclR family transcriptional regulator
MGRSSSSVPAIESGGARNVDSDARSVLRRTVSIVDAFDGSQRVLSLAELSTMTRLPKSTVHRYAEQLVEIGWLERDINGYQVGMRLFEIGSLAGRRERLRSKARPHLQALAASTRMAVNLGVLDQTDVVYLERMLVRQFELPTRDGGRMPAYCTGIGKALLAFSDEHEVDRAIERGLRARTPYTIVVPEVFRAEIADIRKCGIALDREEACAGIACVATAVRGSGRAIAAVSVSGPPSKIDAAVLAPAVRNTASLIWADLFAHTSNPR